MENIYDFTVSGIDGNGGQYYTGMLEPERLDGNGLRVGRAFSVNLDHRKQTTTLLVFNWIGGAPSNFATVAKLKGEIISEAEVPALLKKYKLLEG